MAICFRKANGEWTGDGYLGEAYYFALLRCVDPSKGAEGFVLTLTPNEGRGESYEFAALAGSTCNPPRILFDVGELIPGATLVLPNGECCAHSSSSSGQSSESASSASLPMGPCGTCPATSSTVYIVISGSVGGDGTYAAAWNGVDAWEFPFGNGNSRVTCSGGNTFQVFEGEGGCPVGGGFTQSPAVYSSPPGCFNNGIDISDASILVYFTCPP